MQAQAISSGHADFARRVARIASGEATGKRTLFVGTDESFLLPERVRGKPAAPSSILTNALGPLSIPLALALGLACHGLAMVARAQVTGLPRMADSPDVEMLTQFVLGFLLSLICARALRLTSGPQKVARSLGVVIGVMTFHNLVHLWPDQMALVLTDLWVWDVITHTKAQSILLRGISFAF